MTRSRQARHPRKLGRRCRAEDITTTAVQRGQFQAADDACRHVGRDVTAPGEQCDAVHDFVAAHAGPVSARTWDPADGSFARQPAAASAD